MEEEKEEFPSRNNSRLYSKSRSASCNKDDEDDGDDEDF